MSDKDNPGNIENIDDAWASRAFERARASRDEPHWIPDIAGAVRLSRRHRVRVRTTAAAVVVLAGGLTATGFAVGGPRHAAVAADGTSAADRALAAELAESARVEIGGAPIGSMNNLKAEDFSIPQDTARSVVSLVRALDPTGTHLRAPARPQDRRTPTVGPATGKWAMGTVDAIAVWTPNGDGGEPGRHPTDSEGYGRVDIHVQVPGLPSHPQTPCDSQVDGIYRTDEVTWSACEDRNLDDGSVVRVTHSTNLGDRQIIVGVRILRDGGRVSVNVANWVMYATGDRGYPDPDVLLATSGFVQGEPIRPAPWTDRQLADALSSPQVTGLG